MKTLEYLEGHSSVSFTADLFRNSLSKLESRKILTKEATMIKQGFASSY